MKVQSFLFILLGLVFLEAGAQEKAKIKFGKISPDDFKTTIYSIDSNASAVIIGDIGSTDFVGNSKGGFALEFKRYCRVHILNKNGYDISAVEIPIYTVDEAEEELSSLKAVTYNLENGKVVETKLDPKSGVFKEKISKNKVIKKFTFPAVREGSIIEFEYKLKSDFLFNLRPWEFQHSYPALWSEYVVAMPEFLNYVSLTQGYQPFYIKEQKDKRESFNVEMERDQLLRGAGSERINFSAGVTSFRWVMKDVPALKEESYTSTLSNHLSRIEFQLAEYREPFVPRKVMHTWAETAQRLLDEEDFGLPLQQENEWLDDVLPGILKNAGTPLDKARNIYTWLRDNMTCTNYGSFYTNKSLRSTLNTRSGSEAEINLLLTAMLKHAGLQADPVILSTRSNGYAYALYPLIDRFNYVIARLMISGQHYYLDASRPRLGFNKLGYDCYNGHARVIESGAAGIEFKPESLLEKELTSVFITSDTSGHLVGNVQQAPGYYASYNIRARLKDKGKEAYFDDLRKEAGGDMEVTETAIDSVNNYEEPIAIKYHFKLPSENEDIWYFNPMFSESWKENPFKSAERLYPVEMPYGIDQTFLLRMDVPPGYTVDELPKQLIVKLNAEDEGNFEYRVVESSGVISVRSRIRISRTYFSPEEYGMLREFFNLIVKKHNEQIVFKKKK
jgi:hypothetical protein